MSIHIQPGTAIIVPSHLLRPLSEVVRRGMAFEFGQPLELYTFCEELENLADIWSNAATRIEARQQFKPASDEGK
jgi:hypothetical protein